MKWTAISLLALAACGKPAEPPPPPAEQTFEIPDAPDPGVQIHVEPFRVAAGKEVLMCTYTTVTFEGDVEVTGVESFQRPGGHHSVIFVTDPGISFAPGTRPCADEEMVSFRLIGAGGAEGGNSNTKNGYRFPAGIAQTIKKGAQVVVQSHYVNANDTELKAEDYVNISFAPAGTVKVHADAWAITSLGFEIPAGKPAEVEIPCEAAEDTNVFFLLGHTHAWGKRFTLTREAGGQSTVLYDEAGGENLQFHPPIQTYPDDRPLLIKKGEKLKVRCTWENTTDHALKFPEEMCASLMFYYPSRGFLTCHEGEAKQ